jgi:CBS domain containing-hemolysin-like protein
VHLLLRTVHAVSDTLVNLGLVAVFILIGGVFASTELALVSLREGQAKALGARGRRGARVARLVEDPNRFLAAVQVGVTLAGFLSAAFGASRLSAPLGDYLAGLGVPRGLADGASFVVVVLLITYTSLVLGELAPKRLGLQRAEGTAQRLAPLVDRIATLFRPVIWLLSKSTDLVVRLTGGDPNAQGEGITEEELRDMVAAHESLTKEERKLIDEVFAAGERQLREVMLPRTEVAFLDASVTVSRALRETAEQPHSRYPVAGTSQDDVIGFLHVRDLMVPRQRPRPARRRRRPRGEDAAGQQEGAAGDVGDAPRGPPHGDRRRRVRRHRRHRHARGPHRGGHRRHPRRVRRRRGRSARDPRRRGRGRRPAPPRRGPHRHRRLAARRARTRRSPATSWPRSGTCPRPGEAVEVDGHRLEVSELDGRRVSRVRVTPIVSGDESEQSDRSMPLEASA